MKTIFLKSRQPLITNQASLEDVKKSISFYEQKRQDLIDENTNRFQRYLDCQDDTIIGGLSDQITAERLNDCNSKLDALKKQLDGNFWTTKRDINLHFLINPAGEIVSTKLFNGNYGACFITNEAGGIAKFIGAVKRLETYKKKGVIICQGKLTMQAAVYLHKDLGFIRAVKYGALNPVVYKFSSINSSVGIIPELEDIIKNCDPQKWIKYYSKKENQYKY